MSRINANHTATEIVGAKVPVAVKAQLVELAYRRERNISQEVRLALAAHLEREQIKEQ